MFEYWQEGDMGKCDDVLGTASDVIVLGFELIPGTATDIPKFVEESLQRKDSELSKAIQKVLTAEAKTLMKSSKLVPAPAGGGVFVNSSSGDKAKAQLTKIAGAAGKGAQAGAKKAIERTSEYRDLTKRLSDLECSVKKSAVGVWVDENKNWLYVVATGLAAGGAVAVYATRSGDTPVKLLLDVLPTPLKFKPVGKLEIGGSVPVFKPSTRHVELKTFATSDWKSVKLRVDLHGIAKGKDLGGSGTLKVVVPLSKYTSLSGATSYGTKGSSGSLSMKWSVSDKLKVSMEGTVAQGTDGTSGSFKGTVAYKDGDFTASATGKHSFKPEERESTVDLAMGWSF